MCLIRSMHLNANLFVLTTDLSRSIFNKNLLCYFGYVTILKFWWAALCIASTVQTCASLLVSWLTITPCASDDEVGWEYHKKPNCLQEAEGCRVFFFLSFRTDLCKLKWHLIAPKCWACIMCSICLLMSFLQLEAWGKLPSPVLYFRFLVV